MLAQPGQFAFASAIEKVVTDLLDRQLDVSEARLDLLGAEVRHADVATLAGCLQILERAHRLGERRFGIGPVNQQDVDVGGAEKAQACLGGLGDVAIGAVTAKLVLGWIPGDATLGDDDDALAFGAKCLAKNRLGAAKAVGRRRVKASDAQIERAADGGNGLSVVDAAVAFGRRGPPDRPGAKPNGRYFQIAVAEK